MDKIEIKTLREIAIMTQGGKKLGRIKKKLEEAVGEGVSAADVEKLATDLIRKEGGKPSFQMVPGYSWSTCINTNEGVVHGIPKKEMVFKKGDLVSIDVGLYYQGFHTDTSISLLVGEDKKKERFLKIGKEALQAAINEARVGNYLRDISAAIEGVLKKGKLEPIRALVGHGIGRKLHEAPAVPCFVRGLAQDLRLEEGLVLAIEVMYTSGQGEIVIDAEDKWTIRTKDAKIAGLFEETVAITKDGPLVLTKEN